MKIEHEEINGLLYPKLTLLPQKGIHLTRFGRKKLNGIVRKSKCVMI